MGWGHRTTLKEKLNWVVWSGLVGSGRFLQEIIPLRGSILQVGTCKIFSLAENPRWSRVWQFSEFDDIEEAMEFVEVWEQVMKAERVFSRRFLRVGINHDFCISTKGTINCFSSLFLIRIPYL